MKSNSKDISVRFQLKLDGLPAVAQPSSRFVLAADSTGHLRLRLFTHCEEFEVASKKALEVGEWHHVAFVYSYRRQYAAFYLDCELQWTNGVSPIANLVSYAPLVDEANSEVREYTEYPFVEAASELFFANLSDISSWESKAKAASERVTDESRRKVAVEHVGYFNYFWSETEKAGYGTFPLSRMVEEVEFIESLCDDECDAGKKLRDERADHCAERQSDKASKKFRLMSYNIRSGVGAETWNNQFKPGELRGLPRVARTIRAARADFVCMQEVDKLAERTGCVDQTGYLAEETGLIPYFQDKTKMGEGYYGLAQLARTEALSFKMLKLPPGKDKGHGRICFICEYEKFIIATSHLSGEPVAQEASAEMILVEFENSTKPVFFCGDLNAVPDSPTIEKLKEGFLLLSDPAMKTCHSLNPGECLDYIFVDKKHAGQVRCGGYTVGTSTASDHFPIWVDVEIC